MRVAELLVVIAHLLLAAGWLGAMAYSLAVVQPRLVAFHGGPAEAEEAATYVAAGARWKVVSLLVALGTTGAGLVLLERDGRSGAWWALVAVKATLLLVAAGVFVRVSWRMWPRRLFATPDEVPRHRADFTRAGAALIGLTGTATVLGVALRYV
ncbi:hypothetical protein [Motilibacter aurantiacus]|uniref:hypothetical protein n=1 Tax=Motilibacter aurantiacus TaxID=2714955 RepID=UPI0014077C06|nr:hypothetical protein [Motilibacter aurantiacus]NHC44455.1 hypothetical protein [Motilibacter aurantiacus]